MTETQLQTTLQAINFAIQKGATFFAYRLPLTDEIRFGVQNSAESAPSRGFVVHPFAVDGDCQPTMIVPHLSAEQYVMQEQCDSHPLLPIVQQSTSQSEYLALVERSIVAMQSGDMRKVVISKVIVKPHNVGDWGKCFVSLAQSNPNALAFIYNHPRTGAWMGASPEVLLSAHDGVCHTMALAATKPSDSAREWTPKEIEEQGIVSAFISNTLDNLGISYSKSATYNRKAAGVQHLCTEFDAKCDAAHLDALTSALHPTPALSGMPKAQAIDFIIANEAHQRRYYGGYLGPYDSNGDFRYFVNLRSMQFDEHQCCIYAGGGLTADSNPLDEWNETELKSQLLLSLLK